MRFIFISFGQLGKWHISITIRNLKENTATGMYSVIGLPAHACRFMLLYGAGFRGLVGRDRAYKIPLDGACDIHLYIGSSFLL